jgi:hypothetical protein
MPHRNYFDIFNYGIVPNLNYLSEQRSTRMDKAPSTPPSNDGKHFGCCSSNYRATN